MTKLQFLLALNNRLSALSNAEAEERLSFYSEMIEDRMEDGLTEEEAVAEMGSIDEIAAQIIADIQITKIEKAPSGKRQKPWKITLLMLGAPVWFPLVIAALSVLLALYISLWAIIISLWAIYIALIGWAICGAMSGICFAASDGFPQCFALMGSALLSTGLSFFLLYGCKAATKGAVRLSQTTVIRIKKGFRGKEKHHAA